jgi:hypothetical protein
MSRYKRFDVNQIKLLPIERRKNRITHDSCEQISHANSAELEFTCPALVRAVTKARQLGAPVVLFMGGHLIKLGLARNLIDLIERGLITHVASNGSAVIHDFELALIGGTSENVSKWIDVGQFGLWRETSELNDIIHNGATSGEGLGEAVGRHIEEGQLPYHELSVCAACYRNNIPFTCHVSIGSDIIHMMPNFNSSSLGKATYADFLIFAHTILNLENGVFLNVGSAVAGPEVFLKAISMARNVANQRNQGIKKFTTGVFDLVSLPTDYASGPPDHEHPLYYFRPWKTLLCRTIASEGESHYVEGDFKQSIPAFRRSLIGYSEVL